MSTAPASALIGPFYPIRGERFRRISTSRVYGPRPQSDIPHVIVLEPGLVMFKIYNGHWFFGRPTIEELRQDLRAALKKCRPDWDITRRGLKAAWERSEHERFYPYGKTYGQVFREKE